MAKKFIKPSDYLGKMFKSWKLALITTSVISVIFLSYGFSLPNIYKSSVKISPVEGSNNPIGGLQSGLAGFASLAGVSLPASNTSKQDLLEATIKSKQLFKEFFNDDSIAPSLVASKKINSKKEIIFDKNIYDSENNKWTKKPLLTLSYRSFLNKLQFNVERQSGLIEISFKHVSPEFSYFFINKLLEKADEKIRLNDLMEAENKLLFLNNEINQTDKIEIQKSINSLIKIELEKQMLAKISKNYSYTIVDVSMVPELKYSPSRLLILIAGVFVGLISSVILIALKISFRE